MTTKISDLRKHLKNETYIQQNAFAILKALSQLVNNAEGQELITESNKEIQELVLMALDKAEHFGEYTSILNSLVRKWGLFPYLDPEELTIKDLIAFEYHRPEGFTEDIVFHRM